MKSKKIFVWITVLSLLIGAATVMYLLIITKPDSNKNPNKRAILGVKTLVANHGNYSIDMVYPGRVAAREILTLTSEVGGKIIPSQVPLKIGERFKKGDVIVTIFDEDVRAAHKALISQFLNVLSNSLPDIKIDFPEEYDKWFEFFSKINFEGKTPELPKINSDKEKVYISSKNILSNYYNLIQREIVLTRYQIIAPFNGIYISVNKEVGAITSANSEIAKIVSTDFLELIVGVALEDAQKLSEGTAIDVVSESGKVYKGKIDRIAAFVDSETQRVNVYVLFNEPGLEIVEGQILNLTMPSTTLEDVIECSREALVGDSIIYQVKNNRLQPIKIDVLAKTPVKAYFKGIMAGDTIVGESLVSPYEGMEVNKLDMDGAPVK